MNQHISWKNVNTDKGDHDVMQNNTIKPIDFVTFHCLFVFLFVDVDIDFVLTIFHDL